MLIIDGRHEYSALGRDAACCITFARRSGEIPRRRLERKKQESRRRYGGKLSVVDAAMPPGAQETDSKGDESDADRQYRGERRIGDGGRDTRDDYRRTEKLYPAVLSQ